MAFWNNFFKKSIGGDIDDLLKIEGDSGGTEDVPASADDVPEKKEENLETQKHIGKKALLEDPYFDHTAQNVIFKMRSSRLSNKTLKDVSVRDWIVSTIIQVRCDTLPKFSRPQHERYKEGYRIVKRERYDHLTQEELEEIHALEDFVYHCGRIENTPTEDKMLFGEFLKRTCRDILTIGHLSVEKIKTRAGALHRFRPVPAEGVYIVDKHASKEQLESSINVAKSSYGSSSNNDPQKEQEFNIQDLDYYKWVQVSLDQTTLNVYGDEDMIFKLFNPQNFMDSMGYCYSPLELAIINITNHLNVENYNANFFTHGQASRGILHLKGTVTQSQLHAFRRQFYNNINGAQHAWKTPIIAGLDDVQWVALAGTNREMEYISFNDHILRSICAQFQIDPVEVGLDYLNSGLGARSQNQQANNEYKIMYSRERGLHPILMFYEDFINNDVLPTLDPILAKKYKFEFVGYHDETAQTHVAQLQAEMTVHSTMNDLLRSVMKEKMDEPVADLPLNQAFWGLVEKNYTRGEIRERFFKDKGAAEREELKYIPGDQMFMAWQQLLITMNQQKKAIEQQQEQMQQAAEMQQKQQEQQDQESTREQERHDIEVGHHKSVAAHAAVNASQPGMYDTAKEYGVGSKPLSVGGTPVANPINKLKNE
jgi:hypothetical protein